MSNVQMRNVEVEHACCCCCLIFGTMELVETDADEERADEERADEERGSGACLLLLSFDFWNNGTCGNRCG
jgi:hypothetical protein